MTEKPNGIEFGELESLLDTRAAREVAETAQDRKAASPSHREALFSDLEKLATRAEALPSQACPEGLVVVLLTLLRDATAWKRGCHGLFTALGLTFIGSRHLTNHMDRLSGDTLAVKRSAISVVAAGSRLELIEAPERAERLDALAFERLSRVVDSIRLAEPKDRIRTTGASEASDFEAVLRLMPSRGNMFPYPHFKDYAASLGFLIHENHLHEIDRTLYVFLNGPRGRIPALAEFSFLRQVTEAPKLRSPISPMRSTKTVSPGNDDGSSAAGQVALPTPPSPPPDYNVSVLDGAGTEEFSAGPWIKKIILADPAQESSGDYSEHGLAVLSANLFGPMPATGPIPLPHSVVTVCRVLDKGTDKDDPLTMIRALRRVVKYAKNDSFVNISFGPSLPVSDDAVSAWTSTLDHLVRTRNIFMTVAAGNNGESAEDVKPGASANSRIQVPADAINVIGVGALDTLGPDWRRAPYSAEGPGRKPTIVKPDLLAFGGSDQEPFLVLATGAEPSLRKETGTSFAAPYVLRQAIGLRALAGPALSMLGVKALLIHHADRRGQNMLEVGWGRVPEAAEAFHGRPGESRAVFQGKLPAGKILVARLKAPKGGWNQGMEFNATICFNAAESIHDPASYSETALEADFFRNIDAGIAGAAPPETFFDQDGGEVNPGADPRDVNLATVKSNHKDFDGSDLVAPGFIMRSASQDGQERPPIDMCLVVSIIPASVTNIATVDKTRVG